MRKRTARFWVVALMTGLDIVVLCRYGEVVWNARQGVHWPSATLLQGLAWSAAIMWLHVYRDFRSSLAERSHSSLSDSSRWRDGTDV